MVKKNIKEEKENMLLRYSSRLSVYFIIIAVLGFGIILLPFAFEGGKTPNYGIVGDTVGGLLNPIISIPATILTFLAFWVQYKANEQVQEQFDKQEEREYKINFETKFFELIKIHRENVSEQNYTIFERGEMTTAEGRKVFRLMHRELEECLREVFRYRKMYTNDFIVPSYRQELQNIKEKNDLDFNEEVFALIDMAYKIFFFGLGKESEDYLLNSFRGKYDYLFFKRLMKFLQLKPKMECIEEFKAWKKLYELPTIKLKEKIDAVYRNRANEDFILTFNDINLADNLKRFKYYGGHQHRLGHYFRHLFQTYKYLFLEKKVPKKDKYFYGKTLRGQMSTYEQSIFFINSLSSLGQKWELTPEFYGNDKKEMKLISEFNIIKNVPGDKFLDIKYLNYYPRVDFEFKPTR